MSELEYGRMHYRLGVIGDGDPKVAHLCSEPTEEAQTLMRDEPGVYGTRERKPLKNFEMDHRGLISFRGFASDSGVQLNGKKLRLKGDVPDEQNLAFLHWDKRLNGRAATCHKSMPIYLHGERDETVARAMFPENGTLVIIEFGQSAEAQKAKRLVRRGNLQFNIRNIETVRGGQPIALSLDKPSANRKADTMQQRNVEPLAIPLPPVEGYDRTFSLSNAIRAELKGDWSEAGYEREMCQEARRNFAGSPRGLVIPTEEIFTRAVMTTSGDISGAIGTKLHGDKYIDIARPTSSVMAAGATMLEGLDQNVAIPKLNSDTSASFVAENSAISDDDLDVDQLTMQPRLCAGTASFTRHVLETSSPKIDELVRFGLEKQIMNRIDSTALNGDGSGANPTGVANTTGINTKTTTGSSTMTHAESLEIIAAVAANNLDTAGGVFIIHPNDAATIGATSKDSGSGTFVYENGRVAGRRVIESTHATAGECFFGVFQHLYIGMFGGLDLVIDPYSSARNGVVEITASQLVDVAVAYEKAFNKVTLTA